MQTIAQILEFIKRKETNIQSLSKETGIPADRLYSWRSNRGTPKAEDAQKLMEWGREIGRNAETGNDSLNNTVNEALPEYGKPAPQTMEAIIKLIESNELLAKSNSTAIDKIGVALDSNKILVETNKRLADRVLSQSANVEQQTLPSVDTTLNNLLGLIADVAAGKRFESRREALTVIHKLMHDKTQSNILEGTQKG